MTLLHLPERRQPSNWRRATDQYRDARANRLLDLLDELNAVLAEWEQEIKAAEESADSLATQDVDHVLIYKQRLERVVKTYQGE
jgi:hypothetical protein